MFDLSKPLHICPSPARRIYSRRFWVCEWDQPARVFRPATKGLFLVEAQHAIDARQTAKKFLRDELLKTLDFNFTIREPGLLERAQLKLQSKLLFAQSAPAGAGSAATNKFVGPGSTTGSTSKT